MKQYNRRRKLKPYASYYVTDKINRDEVIFDDAISDLYLHTIERCKKKYSFQIENFDVLENNVSFMLIPGKNAHLPKIMQWIKSVFAKAYNKLTGQSGHVWKERYTSKIIETVEEFIEVFENIVRNPLRANLVQDAKDYRPSGLFHHLHKIQSIITEEPVIHRLFELCKDFHQ
jgi:REP element-mobilizing transposase RayT